MDDATKRKLQTAQKCLRILDVVQREVSCSLNPEVYLAHYPDEATVQFRFAALSHTKRSLARKESEEETFEILEYSILAAARFVEPAAAESGREPTTSEVFASIEVHYSAFYEQTAECEEGCLEAFGRANATFHVWPYWREYLQSQAPRMRLPSVMVGMMPSLVEPTPEKPALALPPSFVAE